MLLAIAGCDTNQPAPYAGVAAAPAPAASAMPAAAAAPMTFPAETASDQTLGLADAIRERREAQ